ncbi:SDR family oxidoreductase [Sinomicrobium sp. M5D2P17]
MKTIFITGASSGLGKTTAKLFQKKGWQVIAAMRNPEKEQELTQLENVSVFKMDVTDLREIKSVVANVTNDYEIDLVMNNAGYGLIGPLEALTDEQISKQVQTNLLGVIGVTKAFIPYFRTRRSGAFINISSSFGLVGFPTCSVYSATKFAVDGFSESLAYELADFGINVKIIAPGGIKTDFATRSMDTGVHPAYGTLTAKVSAGYSPEQLDRYTPAIDIARVVYKAATDDKDQLRYIAGKDCIALYNDRLSLGTEKQYQNIKAMFVSE